MIPFLDSSRESAEVAEALTAAFARVRDGGTYVLGPEVEAFEREFAAYCERSHCIAVGSGLSALVLSLRASGVQSGDEVLVPAYTAVATWMAVSLLGATPIGVDVDPRTFNMDPSRIPSAVTPRTRAVVPVDLFGQPADMTPIAAIASSYGLEVVEDAAQAVGSRRQGTSVGSAAHAATFSFYPTKNLAALGDGGAVVTDDPEFADTVRLLRSYGWRKRGISEIVGGNSRLDELQAALLRVKLTRLDAWTERRRAIASRYLEALAPLSELTLPWFPSWAEPVWHLFVVEHRDRELLAARLGEMGIGTLVHYDPLPHLTPAYRAGGWRVGTFPVAERLAARALSLPLSPQLIDTEVEQVVAALVRATGGPA